MLIWTGAVLTLSVLALAAAEISGWPFLREPLQNAMTRAAGVPVVLEGRFATHLLWRPRLLVEHLNVAAAGGQPVPHLLDARDVELGWRWRDLWNWHNGQVLRVQRLQAGSLDAQLMRSKDGRASWQLGGPSKEAPDKTSAEQQTTLADLPRFGLLRVNQGHVVVDDQPLQTQLKIELRGGEGDVQPDGARAGYKASVNGRWRALPLRLQVRTGGALPILQDTEGDADEPALPVRVEGEAGAAKLLFDGTAAALLGARRVQGKLQFSGPSLARVGEPLGMTLPQTPPFSLRGELGHDEGVWHLQVASATVGRSLLDGDFRYDTRTSPPQLSGRLGGSRLSLADLGPAVGKSASPAASSAATSTAPPPAKTGRVLPQQRLDLPSLRAMDADVQVAIAELDFSSDAVTALRSLQTHLVLKAGVLELQALKASVAGGQFSGSTRLDGNVQPARWAADLRFATVDIAGWLPGLRSEAGRAEAPRSSNTKALRQQREKAREGGAQTVQAYLTGTLSGGVQASGRGSSTAEIMSTLDGNAQLMLRDGTVSHLITELAGLDIAQALGVLIRSDHPLPLRCARLDLQMQQGIVRPQVAVLDNADSTVRVAGQIDLRDESLDLRATTQPKDFSPLTLRAPITVTGTLGAPKVGVDGKRLAGKVLGALALGAVVAPVAALVPLIDPGKKPDSDPCVVPAASAASPASAASAASRGR